MDKAQIKSKGAFVSNESHLITRLRIGKFVCFMTNTLKQIAGFLTNSPNEFKNDISCGGMLRLGSVDSTRSWSAKKHQAGHKAANNRLRGKAVLVLQTSQKVEPHVPQHYRLDYVAPLDSWYLD